MSDQQKIKVLYIAGWGRSGSTILANILGEIDGFFSVGEIYFIWERGMIENRLVGSGETFNDCKIWQDVLKRAYGDASSIDPAAMVAETKKIRTRRFINTLTESGRQKLLENTQHYREILTKLYDAVQKETNCRVIVDSSKYPMYGYMVGTLPNVEMHGIHLIRDPRATAFSWKRRKTDKRAKSEALMPQFGAAKSTLMGNMMNMAAETAMKQVSHSYMRLRYEDFIKAPRQTVETILKNIGEEAEKLPFVSDNEVEMGKSYTISGNPIRFNQGAVKLKSDDEWKEKMESKDRYLVTLLSLPWMQRYGYLGG